MSAWEEQEICFPADDGWTIGGIVRRPDHGAPAAGGVLVVPGSRHERDAYGALPEALAALGLASLRVDIRGRGASLGALAYARMAPRQRRAVSRDVLAAIDQLGQLPGVRRIGLIAEQDTAADAVDAVATDERVTAVALLSARHGHRLVEALRARPLAVFGLVSSEDRPGLRATADAYLASAPGPSRLEIFHGLGIGATMLATRSFEHPDADPIETIIAGWLAMQLAHS